MGMVERVGGESREGGLIFLVDISSQVVCSVGQRNSQSDHRPYHKL